MTSTNNKRLNFILPIWGEKYFSLWVEFTLPSLLSKNNLIGFSSEQSKVHFFIGTDSKTRDRLIINDLMVHLSKYCSIEYIIVDDLIENKNSLFNSSLETNYLLMTAVQNRAIEYALSKGSNKFCFIMADNIFFDGSIKNLIEIIEKEDPSSILVYGMHIEYELATGQLSNYKNEKSLSISSQELCEIAIKNAHFVTKNKFIDSDEFIPGATVIFGDEKIGAVMYMCTLHPLYVNAKKLIDKNDTFDRGEFLFKQNSSKSPLIIDDSKVLILHSIDRKIEKPIYRKLDLYKFNPVRIAERICKIHPYSQKDFLCGCKVDIGKSSEKLQKLKIESYIKIKEIYTAFLLMKDYNIELMYERILGASNINELRIICSTLDEFIIKLSSTRLIDKEDINIGSIKHISHKINKIFDNCDDLILIKFIIVELFNCALQYFGGTLDTGIESSRLYYIYKKIQKYTDCSKGKVIVYGAGEDLKKILLLDNTLDIDYIVDDYFTDEYLFNIEVKNSQVLRELEEKDIIIICSSNYGKEIYKKIKDSKFILAKLKNIITESLSSDNKFRKSIFYKRFLNKIEYITGNKNEYL